MVNPFVVGALAVGRAGILGAVLMGIRVGNAVPAGFLAVTRSEYTVPGERPTTVAELKPTPLSTTVTPGISTPEASRTAYSYTVAPVELGGQETVTLVAVACLVTEPTTKGTGSV
jgi:hypothetical protein